MPHLAKIDFLSFVDIIIVEDDPYYFLQQGEYVPKDARVDAHEEHDAEKFIASLAPSFVKFDYQGRVIRLDTFSKVSRKVRTNVA